MKTEGWIIGLMAALGMASQVTAADKEGVALTVYNGGYGVVREARNVDVGAGGEVKFKDVASQIDATTVHFKSLTDPAAKLLEQNYQYDLVSADKLLQKYLDKPIEVVTKDGKTYSGKLLSFDPAQVVLQDEQAGLAMVQRPDNVKDIRFKALPEGLLTQPTLVWLVDTKKPGNHLAEVTYQTYGMNWHSEYVLVLQDNDTAADLAGWVSVQNNSGKTYKEAKLKFIAGDVRRVQEAPVMMRARGEYAAKAAGAAAPMEEKAFFEYHMYTLPRPSTVADNEVKQLEMFTPVQGMKIDKKYLYSPLKGWRWYGGVNSDRSYGVTSEKKVQVFVEFRNSEQNRLGIPLPAGKIRVYKADKDDKALEFVGEEKIDHTPKDEDLSLEVGNAFDVVGERRQTDYKSESGRHWMSETVEFKLRNHKKEDVTVRVKENLTRCQNWKIAQTSHPDYKKLDAFNVAWDLPVKAEGETILTYTAEYWW